MRAPHSRSRLRRVVVGAPLLALVAFVPMVAATVTRAAATTTVQPATTTTPPTTAAPTTTVPVTTTTVAPTTTTSASSTSTSSSSSSSTSTSTTIALTPKSSGSSTPWGAIIAVLVVIAALALIAATLLRRSQKKGSVAQWLLIARPAHDDAVIARDLLLGATTERGAPTGDSVTQQADAAALELDRAAASAPDDTRRDAVVAVAAALRGLQFALESEALLRNGTTPPTADQLAQADVTHRTRARELDQAMARFDELVPPPEGPATPRG